MISLSLRAGIMALSLCAGGLCLGAPAALAQAEAGANTSSGDYADCEAAIVNFSLYEMMEFGVMKGLDSDESLKALPEAERVPLFAAVQDEVRARRPRIIAALVQANCPAFSAEQSATLRQLSDVEVLRDMMWFGADPTRPQPDTSRLSPEETALLEQVGAEPWFARFMSGLDMAPAGEILREGVLAGVTRAAGR